MCDANLCPAVVAYDAAEARLDELGDLHEHPTLTRGAITANRRTDEVVRERYPCDGAVANRDGNLVCPLSDMGKMAHYFATVPVRREGWDFDPEKLVDSGTDTQSGQYL